MNQYLYKLKLTRPAMVVEGATPEEQAVQGQHWAYVQRLLAEGTLILAGRTYVEDTMGLVIFQAESEAAAREIMENDPAVKYGVMSAELFPYKIALIREANIQA